jgi:hypothetical protein
VKKVCPTLPETSLWKKGLPVKDNKKISVGTVIATFNTAGKYEGHAAIYVSQDPTGISVYDQYVTPPSPKAVVPGFTSFAGVPPATLDMPTAPPGASCPSCWVRPRLRT